MARHLLATEKRFADGVGKCASRAGEFAIIEHRSIRKCRADEKPFPKITDDIEAECVYIKIHIKTQAEIGVTETSPNWLPHCPAAEPPDSASDAYHF